MTDVTDIEIEQPIPSPSPVEVVNPVSEKPVAKRRLPSFAPRTIKILAIVAGVFALIAIITSIVYLRAPTDKDVRAIVGVLPYPAAVVGGDVITIGEYLQERDALDAYFQASAEEAGSAPSEEEIAANIMDTLVHKSAVNHLAEEAGVVVDEARVDAFYQEALGGADQEEFAVQLESMFGWNVDEFRERIVRPVVLAMQLGEKIEQDASLQEARRQKAQGAYDRLVAGEDFAVVAGDTSADSSAVTGGDVGYIKMSEVPPELFETIGSLEVGSYSEVVEGVESFIVFLMTDRVETGDETEVKLSIISIPKVTLEETVQEYLDSTRVWKLVGRT